MVTNDIDRQDYLDLDDALSDAQDQIDEYDMITCMQAPRGSTDMFSCAISAITIKTNIAIVVYALGGDPMA